jgi:hypothetical protein
MKKTLIAAALIASFAAPAFAAGEFYIAQDTATKKCSIVEQKPTSSSMTLLNSGHSYKSRSDAESGMKAMKNCT